MCLRGCSASNCAAAFTTCITTDGVATDQGQVCGCYAGYSQCYDLDRCYGLVPPAVSDYCFNTLYCPKFACQGSGARSGALLSLAVAAFAAVVTARTLWAV